MLDYWIKIMLSVCGVGLISIMVMDCIVGSWKVGGEFLVLIVV